MYSSQRNQVVSNKQGGPQSLIQKQNTAQQRPQSKGLLNRTVQDASSKTQSFVQQQQNAQNRSFNAPMVMRHTSPNQHPSQYPVPQGAATNLQQRHNSHQGERPQNRSRGPLPQQQLKQVNQKMQQQQQQQQQRVQQQQQQTQYQPSVMFKPGQAKQHYEHLKQGVRSEPELVSLQPQPQNIQQQLVPIQMIPDQQNIQMPQARGYQPQFQSNQSFQRPATEGSNFAGHEGGAQNQNPYPRQYPYESNQQQRPMATGANQNARRQQFVSPDTEQQQQRRPVDAMKRSPPQTQKSAVQSQQQQQLQQRNMPAQMRQIQQKQRGPPTHQMKAYETAPQTQPFNQVFHPQQQIQAARQNPVELEEDNVALTDGRYDLPRSSDKQNDSGDEDQIREMENLLAEIGQDVSELKKRPFYKHSLQRSEPRSSAKRQKKLFATAPKSNSLSPTRSYLSNSNDGTHPSVKNNGENPLQHRSLSPQVRHGSNGTGPRKQASSQSRKHVTALTPSKLQQPRNSAQLNAQSSASDSHQWTSPNEHQRVQSQVPQIASKQTPSHTNTMSLTVSVNPDHNQERLFRLSPLSSKMQEDTDGEEQSNSQRLFNLNQSINTSQLDSASPDHQTRDQRHASQLGASQSTSIMQEMTRLSNTRTYEDDDEEVARAIVGATSAQDKNIGHDSRDINESPMQQLHQQPFSEQQPMLRSSNLGSSVVAVRTETPLATSEAQNINEQSSSRAFSRSSNRRGLHNDVVEGPVRIVLKEANCQTDEIEVEEKEVKVQKIEVETSEQESQTQRKDFAPIQLSPFDTYDLFFVKDLVNNLNQDNEVLVDSNQDLKYAFHFLMQKHKQLQQELNREQAKTALFADTQKRLQDVMSERDKAIEHGMQLGQKVLSMNRIVRLAVDEQAHLEQEAEIITSQLQQENEMLRSLLKISNDHASPTTQLKLTETIKEIEKKQAEMAYEADMKLKEQLKQECQSEFDQIKKELPIQIEKELSVKYDAQIKDLEEMYEDKLSKQETETALLKKTLLEQSLQRLQSIQQQHPHGSENDASEESNSLEGSHGLHHFSGGSSDVQKGSDQLQMSSSFSSKNNSQNIINSSVVMQQELDEFAQNVFGDLTKEEQELVSQLTAKAASDEKNNIQQFDQSSEQQQQIMQMDELTQSNQDSPDSHQHQLQNGVDQGFQADADDDSENDDEYAEDFEQFGEVKTGNDQMDEENKLIQVVTNTKPKQQDSDWDFDSGFSNNLFDNNGQQPNLLKSVEASPDSNSNEMEEYMNDTSPPQHMDAKMQADSPDQANHHEQVDLLGDFLSGSDVNDQDDDPDSKQRENVLKQKYDEFFTSESDEIEEDLIDGESSDSDSEGHIDPNSFDEFVEAQNKSSDSQETTPHQQDSAAAVKDLQDAEQPGQSVSPKPSSMGDQGKNNTDDIARMDEDQTSSERRNKYKRDKRSSGGQDQYQKQSSPEEDQMTSNQQSSQPLQSHSQQTSSFNMQDDMDAIEFDPPQAHSTEIIAQDFDDFFMSNNPAGQEMAPIEGNGGTVFDFYDDWEDDGHNDLFSSDTVDSKQHKGNSFKAAKSKNSSTSGGMDEEDRRFFEELSKGFSAKDEDNNQHEDDIPERNELMDDTRATRQMLAVQNQLRAQNNNEGETGDELGTIDFEADREEAKEDEYDFFLDNQTEENCGNAQGYHIIDEADLQDDEEDLEELDEEEKAQRHLEMLKDFKEKMEKEDRRSSRSPRHGPRF